MINKIYSQIESLQKIYREYPRVFWNVVAVTFIDRLGGALLFPFFALYLTSKFNIGMTQVGVLFAAFSLSSFGGAALGGALTDRFGRKGVIIFGLVASSLSVLAMGLIDSFQAFFFLALFVGLLTDVAGPAHQAMIADILPEEKRADGFGVLRVAFNLSVVIGPAIGGILAARSYMLLFVADAVVSLLTASLVFLFLPETKPQARPGAPKQTVASTFAGYGQVFRNGAFMLFLGAVALQVFTYMNMNTTLGVYLRDQYAVSESGYGWLLSLNAGMVVLMQFPITRRVSKYPPMLMMAAGTLLYVVGFSMYGFVTTYALFTLAMAILTLGEMVVSPVSQALVASFAPADMRGRYMAVAGLSWGIPFAVGPYLAGLLLDGPHPQALWYAAGAVGTLSALCFLALHVARNRREAREAEAALQENFAPQKGVELL